MSKILFVATNAPRESFTFLSRKFGHSTPITLCATNRSVASAVIHRQRTDLQGLLPQQPVRVISGEETCLGAVMHAIATNRTASLVVFLKPTAFESLVGLFPAEAGAATGAAAGPFDSLHVYQAVERQVLAPSTAHAPRF